MWKLHFGALETRYRNSSHQIGELHSTSEDEENSSVKEVLSINFGLFQACRFLDHNLDWKVACVSVQRLTRFWKGSKITEMREWNRWRAEITVTYSCWLKVASSKDGVCP